MPKKICETCEGRGTVDEDITTSKLLYITRLEKALDIYERTFPIDSDMEFNGDSFLQMVMKTRRNK